LAIKLGRSLFATDDGKAIRAARFFNVPFIVTPKIVVELFRLQKISFNKARKSLEKLSKIGRNSPEIIAEALISLMEKEDGKADKHKDSWEFLAQLKARNLHLNVELEDWLDAAELPS
jgi:hypothetical protein